MDVTPQRPLTPEQNRRADRMAAKWLVGIAAIFIMTMIVVTTITRCTYRPTWGQSGKSMTETR